MEKKQKFVINAAYYAIIAVLVLAGYRYILPILMPFVIGFFVASVVRFVMYKLKVTKAKYNRALSIVLCAALYVGLVGLLVWVGGKLGTQISAFVGELPAVWDEHLYPFCVQIAQYAEALLRPIDPALLDWLLELGKDVAAQLGKAVTSVSTTAVKWVANGAVGIPNMLVSVILSVVSTFYIAADYHKVLEVLAKLIPEDRRDVVLSAMRYAKTAVVVYIKSYSLMFVLVFVELAVGLLIMDIPYAVLIALGIAVFDLMPVLGTGGILLPWMVVALVLGNIPLGIGMGVLYLVITAVRHAVEPRIVGNQIGLHPLVTLMALILGLRTMGLLGMLMLPIGLVAYKNLKANPVKTEEA